MNITYVLDKVRSGEVLNRKELAWLLHFPPESTQAFQILAESFRISRELSKTKAEIHAQIAINLSPCNCDCLFCSFSNENGIVQNVLELSADEAIEYIRQFEADGANAIYLMSTDNFPVSRFVEIAAEVKSKLKANTTMIANVGDQSYKNALKIKDAGFTGVYHALRLREGIDTGIEPEVRKQSILNFKEAGLQIGICVEPVGPEHTNDELAAMIEFTASINPSFSGAMRRISIPGTKISKRGMISELRMAQIIATTRLGMPRTVLGNCAHEPCTLAAVAGANLFWAEVGANPRDTEEKTEEGRGETVNSCRAIYHECGWEIWDGPSRFFL